MAAKKNVGTLIREARSAAGLTQGQLAGAIEGLSATDISKAERGEKELSQAQLKAIAKATGVTQASLLNAPSGGTGGSKPKPSTSTSTSSAASNAAPSSNITTMKLTVAERKLVQLYRKADNATRKAALDLLEVGQESGGFLNAILDEVLEAVMGKK